VNSPDSLQGVKDSIRREIANISKQELCHVLRNIFRRCEACLEARGQHFKTVL
jgi:hypothetical protein